MALRVISGEFRGRNLNSVKGLGTRPLLGQVREALFNILGDWVAGKEVWDLFAGTGATGIEALSRGAGRVIFMEKSNQALKVLRSNLDLLGPEAKARCHVLKADAWRVDPVMPQGEEAEVPVDLIFVDPPYKSVTEDPTKAAYQVRRLLERLAPSGVICFHFLDGHLDHDDFDTDLHVDIRRWGRSAVALIRREAGPDEAGPNEAGPDEAGPDEAGPDEADPETVP